MQFFIYSLFIECELQHQKQKNENKVNSIAAFLKVLLNKSLNREAPKSIEMDQKKKKKKINETK